MFWVFLILLILYGLYCFTFCTTFIYTAIIEEWWCQNKIPIWIEQFKKRNYQQVDLVTDTIEIGDI